MDERNDKGPDGQAQELKKLGIFEKYKKVRKRKKPTVKGRGK